MRKWIQPWIFKGKYQLKINVKLFGTLGQNFPGYDSLKGMDVDIPDDTRVKDLLAHLDIPETKGCFVSINHCVAKKEDRLIHNAEIMILQSLAGG